MTLFIQYLILFLIAVFIPLGDLVKLPTDSMSDTWKQISVPLDKVFFKFTPQWLFDLKYFNASAEACQTDFILWKQRNVFSQIYLEYSVLPKRNFTWPYCDI